MLNQITIMGRFVKDPEVRYTPTQVPVASFTIAVDRDYADKETGKRDTDFIDCVAWRNTAEFISKYFAKGSLSVVTGRLQIRDWTDKEGNRRRNAEVIVDNIYFGESKRREQESNGYQNPYTAPAYNSQNTTTTGTTVYGGQQGYGAQPAAPAYGTQPAAPAYAQGYAPAATPAYSSTQSYAPAAAPAAPAASGGFTELSDEDGELPF